MLMSHCQMHAGKEYELWNTSGRRDHGHNCCPLLFPSPWFRTRSQKVLSSWWWNSGQQPGNIITLILDKWFYLSLSTFVLCALKTVIHETYFLLFLFFFLAFRLYLPSMKQQGWLKTIQLVIVQITANFWFCHLGRVLQSSVVMKLDLVVRLTGSTRQKDYHHWLTFFSGLPMTW